MSAPKAPARRARKQESAATDVRARVDLLDVNLADLIPNLSARDVLARISEGAQISETFESPQGPRGAFEALCKEARTEFDSASLTKWQATILDDLK
jgi:hypothetical protein